MSWDDEDLFAWRPGAARRDDPDTSHKAARSVNALTLETLCRCGLRTFGDMTTEELSDKTGLSLQTVTPRLVQLERRGLVVRTGLRRAGRSGRLRIVWHAYTDEELAAIRASAPPNGPVVTAAA